jgi:hypothetical protein
MLPHNHSIAVDYDRHSRKHIKRAAFNSRLKRSNNEKGKDSQQYPVRKPILDLGWLKDLRLSPVS